MKAWFISDIHLKSLNERNGNILLRFLFYLAQQKPLATHLFLLGDIFDFWVGDHLFYRQRFAPIIDALVQLKNQGMQIVYVEGNHDVHVQGFWKSLGMESFVEDRYFDLGPWKLRVTHGDLMNPEDEKYLKYRNFIRKDIMQRVAHWLPAKQLHQIGEIASRRSRHRSGNYRRDLELQLRNLIRKYARQAYDEQSFDFIISGHMHFRDEWTFEANGKKAVSINLGSWFDEPKALLLDERGHQWQSLLNLS